jgi:WD40 repeat protein
VLLVGRHSPDGKLIATFSVDGTARIWDARTGQLLRTLPFLPGGGQVHWSPDSTEVATVEAWRIRLWDTCDGCENSKALLALAKSRVTRQLTAEERRLYRG